MPLSSKSRETLSLSVNPQADVGLTLHVFTGQGARPLLSDLFQFNDEFIFRLQNPLSLGLVFVHVLFELMSEILRMLGLLLMLVDLQPFIAQSFLRYFQLLEQLLLLLVGSFLEQVLLVDRPIGFIDTLLQFLLQLSNARLQRVEGLRLNARRVRMVLEDSCALPLQLFALVILRLQRFIRLGQTNAEKSDLRVFGRQNFHGVGLART